MSRRLLLLAAVTAAATVACVGGSDTRHDATRELICQTGDVPTDYLLQISGDFTSSEFADLAHFTEGDQATLREAGFVGGRFSYWKQLVSKPPFDPPVNILCEALEFSSEEGAARYVSALDPATYGEVPGLTWLPEGDREFTAVPPTGGVLSTRAFLVRATGSPTDVYMAWLVTPRGRFVLATFLGSTHASTTYEEQAGEVHSRLLERTAVFTQAAAESSPSPTSR